MGAGSGGGSIGRRIVAVPTKVRRTGICGILSGKLLLAATMGEVERRAASFDV